jgi:hypothetical protein
MNLINLTGYGAKTLASMSHDGQDLVLAVTAARFFLPHPTASPEQPLELDSEQADPPLGDIYCGPPGKSGLWLEGQTAFTKPATDITVAGHARALHDQPVTNLKVTVAVGQWGQEALVFGDRIWDAGMSSPRPFVAMPLVWERAFGGSLYNEGGELVDNEPRNPVGRGLFPDPEIAALILPNIEDPQALIKGPDDHPVPIGFGPVARSWFPRARYAGTYDEAWIRARAPIWPIDFDHRFLCTAPASLQAAPHLRGGEPVYLEGLHREGAMRFRLPAPRMVVRFRFNGQDIRRAMIMDGVIIEPDTGHLTLIHRASVPVLGTISTHRETVIRHIEQWEELVA